MPFRLGRERFAVEVEDGQQADAAIAARAGLDQQRPLAMATPQLLGDGFFRRQDARRDARLRLHHRLHALDHGRPAGRHLERAEIALAVEHAVGQRLLVTEKVQNLVLDRIFADEIDDRHRARLVLAPGACDALFELRRVPRQVDVHDRARDLQVEPDAAAVGGEEQPAGRVLLEADDLGAAALLRHRAGMPSHLHAQFRRQFPHQFQHPLPLGEHDDLAIRLFEQVAQDAFQLFELGAHAAGRIEDRRRVADHAHAGEQHLQAFELLRQQRAALRHARGDGRPGVCSRRSVAVCSSTIGTK